MTVAVLVLARATNGQRTTLAMLTVGVIFMALSDSAFAYLTAKGMYASGDFVDIGWAIAFLMFGMAALISRRVPETEVVVSQMPSQVSMWLPYVPVAIAAVGVYSRLFPDTWSRPDLRVVDRC